MGTNYTIYVEAPLSRGWLLKAVFDIGKLYPSELNLPRNVMQFSGIFLEGLCSHEVLDLLCDNVPRGFAIELPVFMPILRHVGSPPEIVAFERWADSILRLKPEAPSWRVLYLGDH